MDSLGAMRIFIAVVDEGSFTGAASVLNVSKSYVSKQVSELENRLGARLLNRTTRSLDLTDAGATFYQRCVPILSDVEEAERAVTQLQTTPTGQLRISAPMTFGVRYVAPAMADFLARYPDITADLEFSDRKVDLIDEGFDIAIRIGHLSDSSFIARKLAPTERYLCGSAVYFEKHGKPRHPRELTGHFCIHYAYHSASSWRFEGVDGEHVVPIHGRLRTNNGEAMVSAAIEGVGLALLPDFIAADYLADGRLERVLENWTEWNAAIWAVYPHSRHVSAKIRLLVDFLAEQFSALPWRRIESTSP